MLDIFFVFSTIDRAFSAGTITLIPWFKIDHKAVTINGTGSTLAVQPGRPRNGSHEPPPEAVVGVEVRANPFLDLVLQVPVGVVVGGQTSYDFHEGSGNLSQVTTAPDPGMTTAGLLVGLQTRIGGGSSLAEEPDFIDGPLE